MFHKMSLTFVNPCPHWKKIVKKCINIYFIISCTASSPVQEAAVVKETLPLVVPSATYRPVATAAQAANQSTAAAPSALILASNHTAGLSGAPVITPYVPNDNVFVGTPLFADIH